jgi:hypothetical protein
LFGFEFAAACAGRDLLLVKLERYGELPIVVGAFRSDYPVARCPAEMRLRPLLGA